MVEGLYVREASPAASGGPDVPLLFIHGSQHAWWAWESWLGLFAAAGWRSYALSLRNHTGSKAVAQDAYLRLRVADYAEDVLAVARWLGRPAALIGHSMGGIVAQRAAEAHVAAGLVLICAVGPGQLGRIRDPLLADRPVLLSAAMAREFWFTRISDEALAVFHRRLVPESPGVINDYSSGAVTIERARIAAPVLVVGAEHDRTVVPPAPRIAAFYGAECLVVPDVGHDLMLEDASLPTAMRINEWLLARVDQPRIPRPHAPATSPA
jgi:pimeloyl-ACP methyl ester carboxylesterase